MGFFSKKMDPIDKVSAKFLDQYPTWAVQHATQLVNELKTSPEGENEKEWAKIIKKNKSAEKILIDCLTGAHAMYLSQLPKNYQLILGGEKKIVQAIAKWSQNSMNFFMVTSELHKKITETGKPDLVSSFEKMYDGDKKLEPTAIHIGTSVTQEIENKLNMDLGPLFVGGLYRIIFKLSSEQLNWIADEIFKKVRKNK